MMMSTMSLDSGAKGTSALTADLRMQGNGLIIPLPPAARRFKRKWANSPADDDCFPVKVVLPAGIDDCALFIKDIEVALSSISY